MPVDTVAARFANAFTSVGLLDARWEHQADTAWATASLTELPQQGGAVRYASRMVGYQKGDSTHFRTYVTIQPPLVGWQLADTADGAATRRRSAACNAIARAAAVNASASAAATGEETFTVWGKSH